MKRKIDKPSDRISSIEGPGISSEFQQKLKENPFTIPEGYFDSLPDKIQKKIELEREIAPVRPFPKTVMLWASAAAVLVIMSLGVFLRSEIKERKAELLSQNEYTLHQMMQHNIDSSKINDSNSKIAQASKKDATKSPASLNQNPGNTASVVKEESPKQASPSRQKFDKVIKTLEKEGVSDEDIMQYLLDEDIDPADLSN